MLAAKDILKARVVTVDPEMTVSDAAHLFERMRISGAPVVGPRRKLLGVVSRTDLLRRHEQFSKGDVPAFYQEGDGVILTRVAESPGQARVAEVMTPAVLSAEEETPVPVLARFMLGHRIHRVVITRHGALRGIVTTMDFLKLVAADSSSYGFTTRQSSRNRGRPFSDRRRKTSR